MVEKQHRTNKKNRLARWFGFDLPFQRENDNEEPKGPMMGAYSSLMYLCISPIMYSLTHIRGAGWAKQKTDFWALSKSKTLFDAAWRKNDGKASASHEFFFRGSMWWLFTNRSWLTNSFTSFSLECLKRDFSRHPSPHPWEPAPEVL